MAAARLEGQQEDAEGSCRLGAPPRARSERRAGRAAPDARRVAPAPRAAPAADLPAALQEHPRGVALHPHPVHDRAAPLRSRARRGGLLLRALAMVTLTCHPERERGTWG